MVSNFAKAIAMQSAIENGNLTMLLKEMDEKNPKWNISKNPIIDKWGTTPVTVLHFAARHGKLDIFKNVSSLMTNLNPKSVSGKGKGSTPLHWAARNGDLPFVKHISNCLLDINPSETDGETVMHWAARKGHVNVINFYLDNLEGNKNPPQKSIIFYLGNSKYHLRTPLHSAAQNGHLNVVKVITKILSNKNPKDKYGYTPLHAAANKGHLPVVEYLSAFVENVDIQTDSQWDKMTPLHKASRKGHLDVVKYLIRQGADPKLRSRINKTAYDYAVDSDHTQVSDYLEQFS